MVFYGGLCQRQYPADRLVALALHHQCQNIDLALGQAKRVKIDPSLLNGSEAGVLEDLLVAAFNDARGKVEVQMAERMSELTGGLPLPPGFKLPF